MIFRGEIWGPELWLEWADTLMGLYWEAAGKPMPDECYEWNEYRAEWYRALMDCGNEPWGIGQARR